MPFEMNQEHGLLDQAELQRNLLWSLLEEIQDPKLLAAMYPLQNYAYWREEAAPGFEQKYLAEVPFVLRSFLQQLHSASFAHDVGPLVPDVAILKIWKGHYLISRDFGPCCSTYTHEGEIALLKELEHD